MSAIRVRMARNEEKFTALKCDVDEIKDERKWLNRTIAAAVIASVVSLIFVVAQ